MVRQDYINILNYAIQFEGSKVMKYIELSQDDQELIEQWESHQGFEDLQIALREIMRLSDICYKYCSMRKQQQLQKTRTKTNFNLLSYSYKINQCNFFCFNVLYKYLRRPEKNFIKISSLKREAEMSVKNLLTSFLFISLNIVYLWQNNQEMYSEDLDFSEFLEYLKYKKHKYGYLPFIRTIEYKNKQIIQILFQMLRRYTQIQIQCNIQNKQVILYYQGLCFMGDPVSMFLELGPLTQNNVSNPFHLFGYHVAKIKEKLLQKEHLKYSYSAYQFTQLTFELFASQNFFSLLAFRRYRAPNFILDRILLNQNFILLSLMETNKNNINLIKQQITQNAQELMAFINLLIDSYEFEHYGMLLGQNDQDKFYQKLIYASKNQNNRNIEQVVNEIRLPVLDLFNRPAL